MGLTRILGSLAVRATRVLVVEVPGQWLSRVELERQMTRRGWRRAWTPAEADVLAVCGVPGPDLAGIVDRLWEQMPGPRARADIVSPRVVSSALAEAATLLLDTPHHRRVARERTQRPRIPEDHAQMEHSSDDQMSHSDHGEMDHGVDEGHEDIDDSGHGGHGGMDMAPEGIPLAQGGQDRDGLEMDVLHLPLGPVLPFWPAGVVLDCSLQGDVVVDAEVSVVDAHNRGARAYGSQLDLTPAVRCDGVAALLALVGVGDLAARADLARNALVGGDQAAARDNLVRLVRTIRRSWLLRWSLRGVLVLDRSDLERHDLPENCLGDAYDRLLSRVEWVRDDVVGGSRMSEAADVVPWELVPRLITGLELASVRLAVASLNLAPLPTVQEVRHA